ncbi:MAG: ATP-binding protein [Cyclobacteriaceae bacterium]|nr:ATP-binding protein [Cyclobacteriaceae bacterium]
MSYQYNIGCSLENLKGVRDFIRKSLREHVRSDVTLNEIILALDEMCSNLMIHAHHCNPDHHLELTIDVPKKDKVVFEIIDDGEMFDINRYHEPAIDNLVHEKRKGGLGIRLVKSIMDEVQYVRKDGRNVCRLTKIVA